MHGEPFTGETSIQLYGRLRLQIADCRLVDGDDYLKRFRQQFIFSILLMMRIDVLLFATFADLARSRTVSLEVKEPFTVASVIRALQDKFPSLREYTAARILVSVNQEMAGPEQPIRPGDEVGVFPPVSGG